MRSLRFIGGTMAHLILKAVLVEIMMVFVIFISEALGGKNWVRSAERALFVTLGVAAVVFVLT